MKSYYFLNGNKNTNSINLKKGNTDCNLNEKTLQSI